MLFHSRLLFIFSKPISKWQRLHCSNLLHESMSFCIALISFLEGHNPITSPSRLFIAKGNCPGRKTNTHTAISWMKLSLESLSTGSEKRKRKTLSYVGKQNMALNNFHKINTNIKCQCEKVEINKRHGHRNFFSRSWQVYDMLPVSLHPRKGVKPFKKDPMYDTASDGKVPDLESVEYPFIAITPRPTLTRSSSTT